MSGRLEDARPVVVDGAGHAVAAERGREHLEIAGAVLLLAEGGTGDPTGGVVDEPDEREPRSAVPEPVVAAAVGLEQQALAGPAVAAAAMPWRSASAWGRTAGIPQQPSQGSAADGDVLAFGEQLGEMAVVDVGIRPSASSTILAFVFAARRLLGGRPRLPWTRPAGPSRSSRARSRRTLRSDRPSARAASATPSSPAISLEITQARRCSCFDIVMVSFIRMQHGQSR